MRRPLERLTPAGALAAAVVVAVACSSARRGEPVAGPLRAMNASASRGEVAFMEHCHKCHPGGEAGLGPGLNDKPFPRFLKRLQIRQGLGAMPSFPEERLAASALDDVLEYLDALRSHDAPDGADR